jgi:tetratricopeptide (TPR) repeat protein
MHKKISGQRLFAIIVATLCLPVLRAEASAIRLAQAAPPVVQGCVSESVPTPQRIENCTRLINEVPARLREQAYLARGHAYRDGGDLDHAIADYSKAIELQPRDKEAFYSRGYVLQDKGDLDRAIADYTAAIGIDGSDADAFYGRALCYHHKGDLDHAIADYTTVIRLKPDRANAYHNRAGAYRKKGDTVDAIKDTTKYQRLTGKGG